MVKKLSCMVLALILIFSVCIVNVSATSNTEGKTIKKREGLVKSDEIIEILDGIK